MPGTEEERVEEESATTNDVWGDTGKLPETLIEHSVTNWGEASMRKLRTIDTPPGGGPSSDETKGSGAGHFAVDDGRSGRDTMQCHAHGLHPSAELPSY